jgi:hypothetical protein
MKNIADCRLPIADFASPLMEENPSTIGNRQSAIGNAQ